VVVVLAGPVVMKKLKNIITNTKGV